MPPPVWWRAGTTHARACQGRYRQRCRDPPPGDMSGDMERRIDEAQIEHVFGRARARSLELHRKIIEINNFQLQSAVAQPAAEYTLSMDLARRAPVGDGAFVGLEQDMLCICHRGRGQYPRSDQDTCLFTWNCFALQPGNARVYAGVSCNSSVNSDQLPPAANLNAIRPPRHLHPTARLQDGAGGTARRRHQNPRRRPASR